MNNEQNTQPLIRGSRPTVGLLIQNIEDEGGYESSLWTGVLEACKQRDANLICFVGGSLEFSPTNEFEAQRNAIYDLVTSDTVDGLIIIGSIGDFISSEELKSFYDRYRPLPVVSIALTQEAFPVYW